MRICPNWLPAPGSRGLYLALETRGVVMSEHRDSWIGGVPTTWLLDLGGTVLSAASAFPYTQKPAKRSCITKLLQKVQRRSLQTDVWPLEPRGNRSESGSHKKASARRHDGILRFLAAPDPGWWYWWPWSHFFSSKNSRILGGSLKFETQCFWWKFPVVRNPVWLAAADFTKTKPSLPHMCRGKSFQKMWPFLYVKSIQKLGVLWFW